MSLCGERKMASLKSRAASVASPSGAGRWGACSSRGTVPRPRSPRRPARRGGGAARRRPACPSGCRSRWRLPRTSRCSSGRSAWRASSSARWARSMWPSRVLADGHDLGDRLAPGQLVGVVLVGADEDDRPLLGRDDVAQPVAPIEVGGDAQVEDADELVHRGRRARAAEDDGVLVAGGPDRAADDVARLLAEARGLAARARSTPSACWRRAA